MFKILFSTILASATLTANVYAQTEDFGLEEEKPQQEEQITTDKDQEKDITQQENSEDLSVKNEEENSSQQPENEELSYYVQRLNLSVEQLDKAKYLHGEDQIKKEQLMRSLNVIRQQARVLEEQSLAQFESILTPEQKAQFQLLKKAHENEKNKDAAEQIVSDEKQPSIPLNVE